MVVTIDAPPGAAADRLLECLRDYGYTVGEIQLRGRRRLAEVLAPYGEVDGRSSFLRPEQLARAGESEPTPEGMDRASEPLREAAKAWARERNFGFSHSWVAQSKVWHIDVHADMEGVLVIVEESGASAEVFCAGHLVGRVGTPLGLTRLLTRVTAKRLA